MRKNVKIQVQHSQNDYKQTHNGSQNYKSNFRDDYVSKAPPSPPLPTLSKQRAPSPPIPTLRKQRDRSSSPPVPAMRKQPERTPSPPIPTIRKQNVQRERTPSPPIQSLRSRKESSTSSQGYSLASHAKEGTYNNGGHGDKEAFHTRMLLEQLSLIQKELGDEDQKIRNNLASMSLASMSQRKSS
ncbi:hypothetical protein BC829DRAFT_186387 [Chytridium lagenaria]|nr:hypothetical protein BC829DRAFT_186387 [Chytridium lagenaria]